VNDFLSHFKCLKAGLFIWPGSFGQYNFEISMNCFFKLLNLKISALLKNQNYFWHFWSKENFSYLKKVAILKFSVALKNQYFENFDQQTMSRHFQTAFTCLNWINTDRFTVKRILAAILVIFAILKNGECYQVNCCSICWSFPKWGRMSKSV
jgi:hypothetical protein